jgi:hypothetical protein
MTGDDVCGNDRPFQDERVPAHQFGHKRNRVNQYDQRK